MPSPARATPRLVLLRNLLRPVGAEHRALGVRTTIVQCSRVLRLAFFPRTFDRLRRLHQASANPEALIHEVATCLRYQHYLSRRFTLPQRIAATLHHKQYERASYVPAYRAAVQAGGLVLWCGVVDNVSFTIRLVTAQDNSVEGHRSVVLYVGDQRICVMSFSYVDASCFGLPSEALLFVTRNQSDAGSAEKTLFIQTFKQNYPSYLCLAAVSGIAAANGMTRFAAIRATAQVAFEQRHTLAFDRSYGAFWASFQAREIDAQALWLSAPLDLTPLTDIAARHRSRARARRQLWREIRDSASRAIGPMRWPSSLATATTAPLADASGAAAKAAPAT